MSVHLLFEDRLNTIILLKKPSEDVVVTETNDIHAPFKINEKEKKRSMLTNALYTYIKRMQEVYRPKYQIKMYILYIYFC